MRKKERSVEAPPPPDDNAQPRTRPLKGEDAEVQHLTATTNLSPKQARDVLRRHGNDWRKIDDVAKTFEPDD
ncbi:hypothetical protein FJ930_28740 [Mesorhizobium sp. B2-4-15]|nr:hypothetical protein FJ930_28740 [Mesorhizobium sp. B2-4-15]